MKKFSLLFCSLLLSVITTIALAQPVISELKFKKGTSAATVENSLIRGEQAYYSITANANQTMDIRITSLEDNAVFIIYQPGFTLAAEEDSQTVKGNTIKGTTELDDLKKWSGTLPTSGQYLIVVGATRGNTKYTLTVAIH